MRVVLLAFIFVLAMSSCSRREAPVLRVGYDNSPPFYTLGSDGKAHGLVVDILNKAASRRNIRLVWISADGQSIEHALTTGFADAWPVVSHTPGRDKVLHFTEPWTQSDYYLISRSGSGVSRAHSAGIRVALAKYARLKLVSEQYFPQARKILSNGYPQALQTFCAGEADASLFDARAVDQLILNRPAGCENVRFQMEMIPEAGHPASIASSPAQAALADSLQAGIMDMARKGELWTLLNHWSGISTQQVRAFFAISQVEHSRDAYIYAVVALLLLVVAIVRGMWTLRFAHARTAEARLAAADSESRFHAFMDHSPLVGFIKDSEGQMIYVNRRFLEVFKLTPEECVGKNDFEVWPAEHAQAFRANDLRVMESGNGMECVEQTPAEGGGNSSWLSFKFPFRQGSRTYIGGMCVDITSREQAERALRISEERFRSLFAHATVGIAIAGRNGRVERVNPAFCRTVGLDETACVGAGLQHLICGAEPLDAEQLHSRALRGSTFEVKRSRGTAAMWMENCLFAVRDTSGEIVNLVAMSEDITQRKMAEAQLAHQARHDLLTGLPNRRVHETHLEEQIRSAARTRSKVCLLYVDLDDFKIVNDTMGHEAGDLVLQEAARRLSSLVADKSALARIGGDEFVLVQRVDDREEAETLSARLRLAMEERFRVNGTGVTLHASSGFAIYPEDGDDARTLRKKADDAMYEAKHGRKAAREAELCDAPAALSVLASLQ